MGHGPSKMITFLTFFRHFIWKNGLNASFFRLIHVLAWPSYSYTDTFWALFEFSYQWNSFWYFVFVKRGDFLPSRSSEEKVQFLTSIFWKTYLSQHTDLPRYHRQKIFNKLKKNTHMRTFKDVLKLETINFVHIADLLQVISLFIASHIYATSHRSSIHGIPICPFLDKRAFLIAE